MHPWSQVPDVGSLPNDQSRRYRAHVEQFAREDVRHAMKGFGIASSRRASDTDPTEEVFLLTAADFASVDVNALTRALMHVLPHTKVWVVEATPRWTSEPV